MIDNPYSYPEDRYLRILPGYNNIDIIKFYWGYKGLPDKDNNVENATAQGFWTSYDYYTKRFNKIYEESPVYDKVAKKLQDFNDTNINVLNKYPELDSYLSADGVFNRLMNSPYNSQSYQISILRGGYGFGPINIACFLKAKSFNIQRLPDIISGLFISEDSGMTLSDAIKGIREWKGVISDREISTLFESLSEIRILRFLEYIGSIFFTSLLGSVFKDKPNFSIPLDTNNKNIYNIGELMGNNYDTFVKMFRKGIRDKIYMQKETEIFSFEIPTVLNNNEPSNGIFNIGDYIKNYSDSFVFDSEPLDNCFGISKILKKEKKLSRYIVPNEGYNIYDFVVKGLNTCLIYEVLNNIDKIYSTVHLQTFENTGISYQEGDVTSNLQLFMSPDFLIAPRKNYDKDFKELDLTKARTQYDIKGHTMKLNGRLLNDFTRQIYFYMYSFSNCVVHAGIDIESLTGEKLTITTKDKVKMSPLVILPALELDVDYDTKTKYITSLKFRFKQDDFIYVNYKRYKILKNDFIDLNPSDGYTYTTDLKKDDLYFNGDHEITGLKIDLNTTPIMKKSGGTDTKTIAEAITEKIIYNLTENANDYSLNVFDDENHTVHKLRFYIEGGRIAGENVSNRQKYLRFVDTFPYKKAIPGTSQGSDVSASAAELLAFHAKFDGQNHRFLTEKYDAYLNYEVQKEIKLLFSLCGFYFITDSTSHWSQNNLKTALAKRIPETYNFIDRFSLCILKLSTINAFCSSHALNLLSLPDTTKQFYNIYSAYLSDYINIKQEIKK